MEVTDTVDQDLLAKSLASYDIRPRGFKPFVRSACGITFVITS